MTTKHLFPLAVFAAFAATAKTSVSRFSVSFDEPQTKDSVAAALAEFNSKKGDIAKVALSVYKMNDEGFAAIVEAFKGAKSLILSRSPDVKSLAPLTGAGFEKVTIDMVGATDISPLATLTNVRELYLSSLGGNEYKGNLDIAPLAKLTGIDTLSLRYARGMDLNLITGLAKVKSINFYGSSDLDLAPLAKLPALREINVYATKNVKDYNVLGTISTLENVQTGLTAMKDLSWAPQLPKLKTLRLFAEEFTTYAPIAQCKALENLTFWSMRGKVDVKQFADGFSASKLKSLSFEGSKVENITALSAFKGLPIAELNLSRVNQRTGTVDLSFLKDIGENITEINISETTVENSAALSALVKVKRISARKTKGVDWNAVKDISTLRNVSVDKADKEAAAAILGSKVR